MMLPKLSVIALFVTGVVHAAGSVFDPYGPSQSDFGGVGLLQMPTARMAKEGEFSANYRDNDQYRRWSISMQPFEWFEATLRYTDTRTRRYSGYENFSGDQSHKDKGMDFKFRLLTESTYLPQVSVGVRDLMGTGLFDGEYLVASKRYGPFDFTLGMGWGNIGQSGNISNPFCEYSEAWCQRENGYSGNGGKFELDKLLHGPAALFGGIEYQTPWRPLRLKLEYDGNDYSREFAANYGPLDHTSPWNIGAVYRPFNNLETHLSWQRGNTLMWGVTLRTNFNELKPNLVDEPRPAYQPAYAATALATQQPAAQHAAQPAATDPQAAVDWPGLAKALKQNAGWQDARLYQQGDSVTLVAQQSKYRNREEAIARTGLLAANYLPESVQQVQVIEQKSQLPLTATTIDLPSVRAANAPQVLGQAREAIAHTGALTTAPEQGQPVYASERSSFSYSLSPDLTQSLGGAESFYMYQLGVNAGAKWQFADYSSLDGTVFFNLVNNYDKFNYKNPPPDGAALPRVRTWIREYVDSSDVLLNNLQLTHIQPLANDWYGQAYGGYLEMMYAGVGSELLYRPHDKSWAVSADLNWAKQRDWHNTLKMADYDVVTGHVTGYWQLPYLDRVQAKVSVGRYLAGDVGATFDFSKQFDSGVVLGAFATFTDVSAEEYGEGSFTKGIYITIPFDLMLINPTTSKGTIGWVPLTRDGGQMLGRKTSLYHLTKLN